MIKKFTPILFSVAVLFILFVIFWQRGPGPSLTRINQEMEMDMNIRDFNLIQGREDKSRWELASDNAGFLKDQEVFTLDNPVITYHNQDDSDPLVVSASQGKAFQKEGIVHLWPDVQAEQNGIKVNSEKATYKGDNGFVLLEGNVIFSGKGVMVNSPEARINLDNNRITAVGGVKTRLN
ncbi:MAG: LPS export ABC transporter periplasmic protein LptC [Desulfonatronovibrio sp.]